MRWFEWWRWRHTLLLVVTAGFVAAYFGLISWGHVERALARLAADSADLLVLDECVTGDAIVGDKTAAEVRVGDLVDANLGSAASDHFNVVAPILWQVGF